MSTKGFNFLVNHVIFAQLQMKTFNTTIKLFLLGIILNVTNEAPTQPKPLKTQNNNA